MHKYCFFLKGPSHDLLICFRYLPNYSIEKQSINDPPYGKKFKNKLIMQKCGTYMYGVPRYLLLESKFSELTTKTWTKFLVLHSNRFNIPVPSDNLIIRKFFIT